VKSLVASMGKVEFCDEGGEIAPLDPLIDKLKGHLEEGGAKTVDHAQLKAFVNGCFWDYLGGRYGIELAKKPIDALHHLAKHAEPLEHMIEILSEHKYDTTSVVIALGAPATLATGQDEQALNAALRRYEDLLDSLNAIYRALPHPEKKPSHRPATSGALHRLVDQLADYWERETGARFKSGWHKAEAMTNATTFTYEAVRYVDRDALPSLRKAAEATVQRLRNTRK
jgi:hypothetical protein